MRIKALLLLLTTATVAVLAFGVQAAQPAHATTTFTVDRSDDPDLSTTPAAGDCTAAANDCSLRGAINAANNTPGADTINFAIPGPGPHTISPDPQLPTITEAVTINGYSESLDEGTDPARENTLPVGNDAVLKIELDGTNVGTGLRIQAANSTVKGLIINGCSNPAVWINGSGATGNKVEGNFIGTNADGTEALGNVYGVDIEGSNNTVGGTEARARNIISGNDIGVFILATGNKVMGNYIGTNAAGDAAKGNNFGVYINGTTISGGSNNTVGGTEPGARNIISGTSISSNPDSGTGVVIYGAGATGNRVEGNYIGINAAGDTKLANAKNGMYIYNEADNNTIGGTTAGAGNIISGNGGAGVEVSYYHDPNAPPGGNDPTPPTGNRILSNSIYDNDALGIDLTTPPNDPAGVTNNDNKDPDKGANSLQNSPVLSWATLSGGQITLSGLLNSRTRKTFTIQFFSSPTADPSTYGEGKTFLGEIQVKTNRKGKRSFSTTFVPLQPVSLGEKITATATNNLTGDTSEFSKAVDAR